MSFWRKILAVVAVPVVVTGMSGAALVSAQTTTGSGLNISPTRHELRINPGGKEQIKITIRNVSGVDIVARVEVNDFTSDNVTGEPKIDTDTSQKSGASIREFLKNVTDLNLKKDERRDVTIDVEVPANAVSGAYYGVIRYSAVPVSQDSQAPGQVALTASVGTLVLLEVPGNITDQIQVKSAKVLSGSGDNQKSGTFFTKRPTQVAITIRNAGTGFSKPFGKVDVTGMGGRLAYSYELNKNEPKSNILPNSERVFKDDLKNIRWPGRYTVTANLSSVNGGQLVTYSVSFWYMPIWALLIILGLIVVILGGGWLVYRKMTGPKGHRSK